MLPLHYTTGKIGQEDFGAAFWAAKLEVSCPLKVAFVEGVPTIHSCE